MSDAELPLIYRLAELDDAQDMIRVELEAQALLAEQGVHLHDLAVPDGIDEPTSWVLALVAELDGRIVGVARLTELDPALLCLDQVSVDPRHAHGGIGRTLLLKAADAARTLGYTEITGTTFRDVIFNGPFYESLGCAEDPRPHPIMIERRRVERALGLDGFGARRPLLLGEGHRTVVERDQVPRHPMTPLSPRPTLAASQVFANALAVDPTRWRKTFTGTPSESPPPHPVHRIHAVTRRAHRTLDVTLDTFLESWTKWITSVAQASRTDRPRQLMGALTSWTAARTAAIGQRATRPEVICGDLR